MCAIQEAIPFKTTAGNKEVVWTHSRKNFSATSSATPSAPSPSTRWRTSDTVGVARGIYEDRAFERMPILADALMDAGCDDEQVLGHCRGGAACPRVLGCGFGVGEGITAERRRCHKLPACATGVPLAIGPPQLPAHPPDIPRYRSQLASPPPRRLPPRSLHSLRR